MGVQLDSRKGQGNIVTSHIGNSQIFFILRVRGEPGLGWKESQRIKSFEQELGI